MNKIQQYQFNYGFIGFAYWLIQWKMKKFKWQSIGKSLRNENISLDSFIDVNKFHQLYNGKLEDESHKILNGQKKILFYENFDEEYDIKIRWENNRLHDLVILALDADSEKSRNLLFEKLNTTNFNNIFSHSNAMEVSISAINILVISSLLSSKSISYPVKLISDFLKSAVLYIIDNIEMSVKRSNNHYFFNLLGLLFITHSVKPFSCSESINKYASQELCRLLKTFINSDGSLYEGSTYYHKYVLDSLMLYLVFFPNCMYREKLTRYAKRMYMFCNYIRIKDQIIGLGDNDSGRVLPLPSYFDYSSRDMAYTDNLFNMLDTESVLSLSSVAVQNKNFSSTATSFGVQILRKGKFTIAHRCENKANSKIRRIIGGHCHNDQGSFQLYIDNILCFTEKGTYSYSLKDNSRINNLMTMAHNTVVIDNLEQDEISRNWEYKARKSFGYVKSDLNSFIECTINKKTDPEYIHNRKVTIEEIITIEDYITADSMSEYARYIHLVPDSRILSIADNKISIEFFEKINCIIEFDESSKVEISRYYYSSEYGMKKEATVVILRSSKKEGYVKIY